MGHGMTCATTLKTQVAQGGANHPQTFAPPPPPPTGAVGGGGAPLHAADVVAHNSSQVSLGSASFFDMIQAATTVAIKWNSGDPAIPSTSTPNSLSKPRPNIKKNGPPKAHMNTNATTAFRVAGF
jgi:hypothetical protein